MYLRPSSFLRGQLFLLRSLGFTTSPEQSTGGREVVLSHPRRWRRRRNTSSFWRSWFWSRSEKNTNRRRTTRWMIWGGTSGTTGWNGRREKTVCSEPKAWISLKEQMRLKTFGRSKIDQKTKCMILRSMILKQTFQCKIAFKRNNETECILAASKIK